MFCNQCGGSIPFEEGYKALEPCVFCEGSQAVDHIDLLSHTALGLVREQREAQIELARTLGKGIFGKTPVVAEAGTGVGKSFAYLLPSIMNKPASASESRRIIISTAKKSLQDQLIKKDLPYIQSMLKTMGHRSRLFKFEPYYGRGNHACKRAVKQQHKKKLPIWEQEFFDKAEDWLWENAPDKKKFAYRSDLNAENCVGVSCEFFKQCAYVEARKRASDADIVVTNHWIVGYHLRMREEEDDRKLLGDFRYVVVDEAHKLEDGIRAAFTHELSENTMNKLIVLCQQCDHAKDGFAPDQPDILPVKSEEQLKGAWTHLFSNVNQQKDMVAPILSVAFQRVKQNLVNIDNALMRVGVRPGNTQEFAGLEIKARATIREILSALAHSHDPDGNYISYVERRGNKNLICVSPVSVKHYVQKLHSDEHSVAHLSATLAVNGSLDTFTRRVGLSNVPSLATAQYGSAFNINRQAILYLGKNIPKPAYKGPDREAYIQALTDDIDALIGANEGNAFVLFTSRADMNECYGLLSHKHRLITQDQYSAQEALRVFRVTPNCSLFGLKSFWEGVDVQGDKLSLVIVTKLPFPPPDPIVEARREAAKPKSFHVVDLPDMILDLRQGVGRLIRSKKDRGVIAILDSRVLTNRYGKTILRSIGIQSPTTNRTAVEKQLRNLVGHRNVQ